jgi:adenylate cyclase class 2
VGRNAAKPRYKEKLERELTIRRPNRWPGRLKALGFRPAFRYEKYRTSLRLPRLHVDLDETPVGNFLELEGSPLAIERVAGALGYTSRDYLRDTYWELYAADCKRKGRIPGNMVFDR